MDRQNDMNALQELAASFFVRGEYPDEESLLANPGLSEAFLRCEEAFFHTLQAEPVGSDPFSEEIDQKTSELLWGRSQYPLPAFLREYTDKNLGQPQQKDNLILRLNQKGIQVIQSLLESVQIKETWDLAPSLRATTADALSSESNSVIFEETTNENQKFYYQIVKENQTEVYLSVKAEGNPSFQQVNLRRDGRFILSNKVNADGAASFSGLQPGNYTIEFLGSGKSKSFDLSILLG
ncbi:hypothetical protein P3G55_10870 [Leptospira sp. 96542]|nr:hypothetical protein [Leptospira sp. 96542]